MLRKALIAGAALLLPGSALAQISDDMVKIGVLTDKSGIYADLTGEGSVVAATMAVGDFGGKVLGKPVVVVSADHQNKADVASSIARQWIDADKVDALVDIVTSSVGLAVQAIGAEKGIVTLNSGAATVRLTGKECSPTGFHWVYDTYALAHGTAGAVVATGGDRWFFLTADYAFGHSLEADTAAVVKAAGGTVVGAVRHPFPASDLSAFLLQAQASGAKVVGLANAGQDLTNSVKQAAEFGLTEGGRQRLVSLLGTIIDVHSMGLPLAKGLVTTEGFYWDADDETRAWSRRFLEKTGRMPTMIQAGVYSSTLHYLRSVEAAGTDEGKAVAARIRSLPIRDFFAKNGRVAANGRMIHDMYLFEVKAPQESKGPWDYYRLVKTIPGDQAFQNPAESGCPLVK